MIHCVVPDPLNRRGGYGDSTSWNHHGSRQEKWAKCARKKGGGREIYFPVCDLSCRWLVWVGECVPLEKSLAGNIFQAISCRTVVRP